MKDFFKNLSLFKTIEEVQFSQHTYADKSIIKLTGEPNFHLGIIITGEAVMQHITVDGQLMTVTTFKEGETFGGNRIFCNNNRFPLTIIAKGETKVAYISKEEILNLCQTNQHFLIEFLKDVADKSDILSRSIKNTKFLSIEEQIIRFLTQQMKLNKSTSFDLNISKKEWAEQLGIQRTSLSRTLQKMQQKGWLSYKNHHYQLLNYEIFDQIF